MSAVWSSCRTTTGFHKEPFSFDAIFCRPLRAFSGGARKTLQRFHCEPFFVRRHFWSSPLRASPVGARKLDKVPPLRTFFRSTPFLVVFACVSRGRTYLPRSSPTLGRYRHPRCLKTGGSPHPRRFLYESFAVLDPSKGRSPNLWDFGFACCKWRSTGPLMLALFSRALGMHPCIMGLHLFTGWGRRTLAMYTADFGRWTNFRRKLEALLFSTRIVSSNPSAQPRLKLISCSPNVPPPCIRIFKNTIFFVFWKCFGNLLWERSNPSRRGPARAGSLGSAISSGPVFGETVFGETVFGATD